LAIVKWLVGLGMASGSVLLEVPLVVKMVGLMVRAVTMVGLMVRAVTMQMLP
jgi:hypothetical protein